MFLDPIAVPGLSVSPPEWPGGVPVVSCRAADLNHDGERDLLTERGVMLRAGGRLDTGRFHAMPEELLATRLDVAGDALYSLSARGLSRWEIGTGGWEKLETWETADGLAALLGGSGQGLGRYLHDVDGDGTPEAVMVSPQGVHVLACANARLIERAVYSVLPPMQIQEHFAQPLWPEERRRVSLPARSMSCRVLLEGPEILVASREVEVPGVRYALRRYRSGAESEVLVTEILPETMRPCRLNADAQMDFWGGAWSGPGDALLPLPVYDLALSVDGGRQASTRRVPGLLNRSAPLRLADLNGDGRLDLITMGAGLAELGTREAAQQLRLRAAVDVWLAVYPQTDQGFRRAPTCRRQFTLELSAPPLRLGARTEELDIGGRIDPGADFDGDGRADLLVSHGTEEVCVYLWTGNDWSTRPVARARVPSGGRAHAADVDGDGHADLVMRLPAEKQTTVHFNAGASR